MAVTVFHSGDLPTSLTAAFIYLLEYKYYSLLRQSPSKYLTLFDNFCEHILWVKLPKGLFHLDIKSFLVGFYNSPANSSCNKKNKLWYICNFNETTKYIWHKWYYMIGGDFNSGISDYQTSFLKNKNNFNNQLAMRWIP